MTDLLAPATLLERPPRMACIHRNGNIEVFVIDKKPRFWRKFTVKGEKFEEQFWFSDWNPEKAMEIKQRISVGVAIDDFFALSG